MNFSTAKSSLKEATVVIESKISIRSPIASVCDDFEVIRRYVPIGLAQESDTIVRPFSGKRVQVRAATTANITISTALNNDDTLDDVTLATNDLVLVKNQTDKSQNRIIVV